LSVASELNSLPVPRTQAIDYEGANGMLVLVDGDVPPEASQVLSQHHQTYSAKQPGYTRLDAKTKVAEVARHGFAVILSNDADVKKG
jgi:hypothetical protein